MAMGRGGGKGPVPKRKKQPRGGKKGSIPWNKGLKFQKVFKLHRGPGRTREHVETEAGP